MKRLTHSNETERREGGRRVGFGAALAVAGLMGVTACATTHATTPVNTPRYLLATYETVDIQIMGQNVTMYRLPESIQSLASEATRYWTERPLTSGYSSSYLVGRDNAPVWFMGTAFVEEDQRWYFAGIITNFQSYIQARDGPNANIPSQMVIVNGAGVCRIDAEPFRALVKQMSGREVVRMRPIFHTAHDNEVYLVHMIPLDSSGIQIGQYEGGQLALSTSYNPGHPESGCNRGMTLLLEPGVPDPRNQPK